MLIICALKFYFLHIYECHNFSQSILYFQYKEMYKNYSLKPQTNILLYGAPGTGKTLLASVVASECGLNFISIKVTQSVYLFF